MINFNYVCACLKKSIIYNLYASLYRVFHSRNRFNSELTKVEICFGGYKFFMEEIIN